MEAIVGDVVDCQFDERQEDGSDVDMLRQRIRDRGLSLISAYLKRKRARKR